MTHTITREARVTNVGVTNHPLTFVNVPAGSTLWFDFIDRTGGAVISSFSDDEGGTWVVRAEEQTFSTFLIRRYVRENCGDGTNIVATAVTSVALNSQVIGGRLNTDTVGQYVTYDAVGTPVNNPDNVNTASGNVALSQNNGSILGLIALSAAQGTLPTVTTGDSTGPAITAGARSFDTFTAAATSGTYNQALTLATSSASRWIINSFRDSGAATPPPTIIDVNETDEVVSGSSGNEIDGTDFDSASVEIEQADGPISQTVTSQDADTIVFTNVFDTGGGPHLKYGSATLRVINTDTQEDTLVIDLITPADTDFVDLVAPLADSGDRITAIPDLEGGDQLEWGSVVGGTITDVIVFPNASIAVDPAVTQFQVRAWDVNDATWGEWVVQNVGTPSVASGYVGGTAVSDTGVMQTIFLADDTEVPVDAVFINGIAHDSSGFRYVCTFPIIQDETYKSGIALRADGAMIINSGGVISARVNGWALTSLGEVVVTVAAPDVIYRGFGLLDDGTLCVTDLS